MINKIAPIQNKRLNCENFYIVEHSESSRKDDIDEYFTNLISTIKNEQIKNIIIKSHSFSSHNNEHVLNHIELIGNILFDGTIIIEVSKNDHFDNAMEIIKQLTGLNDSIKYGLSFSINNKKSIFLIDQLFNELSPSQLSRFTLRVKKGSFHVGKSNNYSYEQQIKMNTYYKWSIYTIMNYTRKNNCKCLINSNNFYDIAWGLARRAQMNMEKNIRFETNITKFPNIAKVLYMINQTAVHAESIFITQNVTVKLDILINKLIHQGQIYNGYKNPSKNQKIIFKKSHKRFFNYLRRNYLEKYLIKHKLNQQKKLKIEN